MIEQPETGGYPWHAPPPRRDLLALTRPEIQGRRAGFVTRMLANVVDAGVVIGVLLGAYTTISIVKFLWAPQAFHFLAPNFAFVLIIGGAVEFVYLTAAWRIWGRTWGDQLLGLRVISFRGTHLRWAGATVRAALCVTIPIGLVWVLVSRENRSAQDVVLRTSVVYDWPRRDQVTS
ncbi:MAG TPA: RDD family protein [Jatrophihabitantaceae bacterium]|jgi:uncharacterized RDD family membrane protein YckC|nr:RDD family protein [Jatrophihabitantaceae bacterium]